ncbi:MAG TPA: hypothetical protein ENN19_19425, partial [Chloroflexi bacterium]|nr:hypothetical protein [Chloroflexota bacterium]
MTLCPNCASKQPDGAAFCDECGARLEAPPPPAPSAQQTPTIVAHNCPVCHAPTLPGEAFCENCGAALTPQPPPSQP